MTIIFRVQGPWRTKADLLWGACPAHRNPHRLPQRWLLAAICVAWLHSWTLPSQNPPPGIWNCIRRVQAFHEVGAVRWEGRPLWATMFCCVKRRGGADRQTDRERSCPESSRERGPWWAATHQVWSSWDLDALPPSGVKRQPYIFMVHWPFSLILASVSRRRQWHPTPVLLPGKSHGGRSLVGCSPWGCEESDTTERLHFHFSHSCIGEGNGNPLQCSCLENPGDGGAWWAAIYGVAQSQTWLKWLSSSSSLSVYYWQLISSY